MIRVALIHLFVAATALCSRADEIDDLLRREMDTHHIPGLVVAVVQQGKVAKTNAYGLANLELNVPVRLDTVFEIGSITKQFTAACVLMLAERGKLTVDDAVTRHIPSAPSGWSNITIRHLLTHTSGIKNYTGQPGFELTKQLTQEQFVSAVAALPADFAPGEQAKYCNSGYNLLGYIVENASGRSYWDFLAERIWAPLGISTATNRHPRILVPQRADGYVWRKGRYENRDSDLTDVFAAGSIVSTIGDLIKWNAALDEGRLLSASSRTQMWSQATLKNGELTPYGFGWRVGAFQGHRNIGHSGSTSGFSASLQRFPDDRLAVVVLCNSDETNIATTLARKVAGKYLKIEPAQ